MADLRTTLTLIGRNQTKRALGEVRNDVRALGSQFRDLKREAIGLAGITIGIGGLVQATRQASEFGKALAEVTTLLDDATQIDGLRKSVEQLSRQYGGDVITNTRALYNIISAGASDAAEATELLSAANQLAIGGVTDVATAADGLTSILNAYGPAVGNAASVSDALFVTMRAGKTTIGELSSSIGQVAPLASNAGVSLEQLLAATAAITKGGVRTTEAMTQLRSVLAAVVKPSAEAVALAKELGIQFDIAAIRSQGFAGFLGQIRERTGGSEAALATLFGRIEALQGVLSLTGAGAEDFSTIIESMGEKAGQTAIAVEKMLDTPAAQAARFEAALGSLQRAIGDVVVQFSPILEGATDLVDGFAELNVGTGNLVTQLGTLALLLGAGRLTGSLSIYAAANAKAAIDSRRLSIATLEGLRAKEADALAARAAAVANLNMARIMDQATGGMARQAVAARQVAAAHATYTAAATASANAARGLSVAAAAGRGALALLGGPVSAITTALLLGVTAWSAYGSEAEAATADLESFNDTADRLLGNLDAITRRQIDQAISLGETAVAAIESRIKVVSAALQSTRDERRAVELRRELTDLQAQEIEQGDKLVALRTKLATIGTTTTGAPGTGVAGSVGAENETLKALITERDQLVKDLQKIDESLTAVPDPDEQTQAANIARLNTTRGQAGGSLESGDTEGALRKMQEARSIIAALAESGETSTGYLQTQIRLVTELAGKIKATQPEANKEDATKELQNYAAVRDQFLQQNPGATQIHVAEQESLAKLQAFLARMQAEADKNAITVPVTPVGAGTTGNQAPQLAGGGQIRGPGTGTSDSVLAWLSNGEYVLRAQAAKHYGLGFLNQINRLRLPRYAAGGLVQSGGASQAAGTQAAPIILNLGGQRFEATISGDSVGDLRTALRRENMKRGSRT